MDDNDKLPRLPINNMAERHVGLTPAVAETYLEAARVCLSLHHVSPQKFLLKNEPPERKVVVVWEPPDKRCYAAWANLSDAARDGAYACAIAAAELSLGFFAVRRAETLTGADYYISSLNEITEDLENCFRLEVSGTNRDFYEVEARLKKRINQTKKGQSNLPAVVVIVGFHVKLILMQLVGE